MATIDLPHDQGQPPVFSQPVRQRRSAWALLILTALLIIVTVQVCSWIASLGLVLDQIGESGRSRLDADYRPWEHTGVLPLDIPRLATAASRGDDNWNSGNLPPVPGTATPLPGIPAVQPTGAAATDQPTDVPTATPPTSGGSGGNPTPVPPTSVPPTSVPTTTVPTPVPPTPVPPTPVPPTPVPPTPVPPTPIPPTPVPPTPVPPTPVPPTPVPPTPIPPTPEPPPPTCSWGIC